MSNGISGFETINATNKMNFYKSMFGSMNKSSNGIDSLLTDYASIKSGSYGKLLKAYYAKQNSVSDTSDTTSTDKTKEDSVKKNELSRYKGNAEDLSKAAQALYKDSTLFEKIDVTVTDEQGNETVVKDYDRDKINSRIKDFAESYNAMMKEAKSSDDKAIQYAVNNTQKKTDSNKNMLDRIGITVGSDGMLTVDDDKLQDAEMSDIQILFSGIGSYAYGIDSNAASVSNYVSGKISDSSLYTSKATTYNDINAKTIEDYL